ncbi:HEAT repeat-containing protein 4-like [Physella acuta]|uniref:HEAT repeat-containing protein 4-like n=1 Tax=Physella acuta TaxID=109671 RepID=UPI0027DDB32F|nr:HEAT repeat-containing protein 4-like [Physella acuta]XP_059168754.1 HEAT repeat-containing protein 4-like [Physella acuta]
MNGNIPFVTMGFNMLFPCATGIQAPQNKRNDSSLKSILGKQQLVSMHPMTIIQQDINPVSKRYVKMISEDLSFSEDVVAGRCLHSMPYNPKYFEDIFKPGELIMKMKRERSISEKYASQKTDISLNVNKKVKPLCLPPLDANVKGKATQLHQQALVSHKKTQKQKLETNNIFMTECPTNDAPTTNPKLKTYTLKKTDKGISSVNSEEANEEKFNLANNQTEKNDWDEFLMSKLSQLTANWIAHECTPEDQQKGKLTGVLKSWYGAPTHTDLVREDCSDGEEDEKKTQVVKTKWVKQEGLLLSRIQDIQQTSGEALDPYSDDNRAPFYRQPAGVRAKKKIELKEEGAMNATAQITLRERQQTPPLRFTDIMSAQVGDKVYQTENQFQQEWLSGKKQVFVIGAGKDEIIMETENRYKKNLQQEVPQKPEVWSQDLSQADTIPESGVKADSLPEVGAKRWTNLPEPVDTTKGLMVDVTNTADSTQKSSAQKQQVKHNNTLVTLATQWRKKWFMSGAVSDSTPDDLVRDMTDIQAHVRMKAIGTILKAREMQQSVENHNSSTQEFPEKIYVALECLLDDKHEEVKKSAAMTLYALDRPTDKAKEVLYEMLNGESSVDRWAAAQSLAHFGEMDSDIVGEMIRQLQNCQDPIQMEQGVVLLNKLSSQTNLVHCMVAEQLNSNSWRHRVMACRILPALSGTINQDITQKLTDLMWHDWHDDVRVAAAQCLGKTSHGREVHDKLREHILHGEERSRADAIDKLGKLGLMTSKLLPAFLQCFSDPYVSVRSQACLACGELQIKEEQVIDSLVNLATFDPIWKVKALAIQALGRIGCVSEDIKECLVWALRYESHEGVRAEACHTLAELNIHDDDVMHVLQERLLVESSLMVREEIIDSLSKFGFKISEEMDTVGQIKAEVHKLCTRNLIAAQILVNEKDELKRSQLERFVCQTALDIEVLNQKKAEVLHRIILEAQRLPSAKSDKVKGHPTPDLLSREGTSFSAADKELEEILGLDECGSVSGSVSEKSTFPETAADLGFDLEPQAKVLTIKTKSRMSNMSNPRYSSVSRQGYRHERSSSGDRISRESLLERSKVERKMAAIFADLEARYDAMKEELLIADRGLTAIVAEQDGCLVAESGISHGDAGISQGDGGISQCDGGISQCDNGISQGDGRISQGDGRISQGDGRISQGDGRIRQGDGRISQGDGICQGDGRISQGDGRISQGDDGISQGDDGISQGDGRISQGDGRISQGDGGISQGDGGISQGDGGNEARQDKNNVEFGITQENVEHGVGQDSQETVIEQDSPETVIGQDSIDNSEHGISRDSSEHMISLDSEISHSTVVEGKIIQDIV